MREGKMKDGVTNEKKKTKKLIVNKKKPTGQVQAKILNEKSDKNTKLKKDLLVKSKRHFILLRCFLKIILLPNKYT